MVEARRILAVWDRATTVRRPTLPVVLLAALLDEPVTECAERDVASRDVLLARFLLDLAGPATTAVVDCPGCGELLDVPVDVATVADMPVHSVGEEFIVRVDGHGVRYRLPTSADVAAVAALPGRSARQALLDRCTTSAAPRRGRAERGAAVERAMEQVAPAGAVDLVAPCPRCGDAIVVALDVALLLRAELETCATDLLQDIHTLAAAYGWTEDTVLSLGPRRRAAYLALVQA